jgi:hypothetical protein
MPDWAGELRSGTMHINPYIPALVGAVAIAVAPIAEAAPSGPTCTAQGATSTLCQTSGSAQLSATPPPVNYQAQYPFFGPYTLLFHHGGHHN